MSEFNWLHLTDLHWGLDGQKHLFPNVRQAFFEDLKRLHEKSGPWQAVLFSGDLVQEGAEVEFKQLEKKVLGPLWTKLAELGSDPVFLAVPGNHDLQRPDGKRFGAATHMLEPELFPKIAEEFWRDKECEYRQVVRLAFANYEAWWNRKPHRAGHPVRPGLLPGEFSTTFETADGRRIGILGLNSTFLQLKGGDFKERLVCDARQFHAACPDDDGAAWAEHHDVCILMTHQGPGWLNKQCQDRIYPEINPAGRFAVHLFGHMHEHVIRSISEGGGKPLRLWQGPSLFGLEHYGEEGKEDRRHGYAASRLQFDENGAWLTHWPRRAILDKNGCRFVPDHDLVLADGESTKPVQVLGQDQISPPNPARTSEEQLEQTTQRLLAAYHRTVQESWDSRWSRVIDDVGEKNE